MVIAKLFGEATSQTLPLIGRSTALLAPISLAKGWLCGNNATDDRRSENSALAEDLQKFATYICIDKELHHV